MRRSILTALGLGLALGGCAEESACGRWFPVDEPGRFEFESLPTDFITAWIATWSLGQQDDGTWLIGREWGREPGEPAEGGGESRYRCDADGVWLVEEAFRRPAEDARPGWQSRTVPLEPFLVVPRGKLASWTIDATLLVEDDDGVSERHHLERLEVIGKERVETPAGVFRAVRLHREREGAMTSQHDVWLTPGVRGYVRADPEVMGLFTSSGLQLVSVD